MNTETKPELSSVTTCTTYNVVNRRTGKVMSKNIKSKSAARKARDRHDNNYGAYAHIIQAVV
jgi:hypothetical protein